jgi:hypothetical protein
MPILKAFASNKYRAISVPRPHQIDLRSVFMRLIPLCDAICIDTRHKFGRLIGIQLDSVDNLAGQIGS